MGQAHFQDQKCTFENGGWDRVALAIVAVAGAMATCCVLITQVTGRAGSFLV